MTLGVLTMAATTWFSSQAGHAVTVTGLDPAIVIFLSAWPIALIAMVFPKLPRGWERGYGWLLVTAGLLVASTPFASFIITPILMGYGSHDTTP